MDVNLDFMQTCISDKGVNNTTLSDGTIEGLFKDLFDSLDNLNEFENGNIAKDEENEEIDYNLLSSMVSNFVPFAYEKIDENSTIQQTSNLLIDDMSLSDISKENLKNKEVKKITEEEIELLNRVSENLTEEEMELLNRVSENLTEEEIELLNSVNENSTKEDKEKLKQTTEKSSNKDVEQNILTKNETSTKFNELEFNVWNNKYNFTEKSDREIDTLEGILGDDKLNYFISMDNSYSIENINKNIDEIQQPSVIRSEFMTEDIVKTVNYLKTNNLEEMTMKIAPKELGELTIKIIKNLDETNVNITISKNDTFEMINRNLDEIVNHLKEIDFNVKNISVDISVNNQNYFSDNLNQQFNKQNQRSKQRNKNKIEDIDSQNIKDSEDINTNEDLNILI